MQIRWIPEIGISQLVGKIISDHHIGRLMSTFLARKSEVTHKIYQYLGNGSKPKKNSVFQIEIFKLLIFNILKIVNWDVINLHDKFHSIQSILLHNFVLRKVDLSTVVLVLIEHCIKAMDTVR